MDAYTKAREIAMGSGIMKELREGKSPEEVSRYENLEELLNAIKVFTECCRNKRGTLNPGSLSWQMSHC